MIFILLVITVFFIVRTVWFHQLLQRKAATSTESEIISLFSSECDRQKIDPITFNAAIFTSFCFPDMNTTFHNICSPACKYFRLTFYFHFCSLFTLNLCIWKSDRVKGALGRLLIIMFYPQDCIDHWLLPSLATR